MLAPKSARPRRVVGAAAVAAAASKLEHWSLDSAADVPMALDLAMAGDHSVFKIALVTNQLFEQRLQLPSVPQPHVDVLRGALCWSLVNNVIALRGFKTFACRFVVFGRALVLKGKLVKFSDPLSPQFYDGVDKQFASVDAAVLSITGALLDLAIPAAIKSVKGLVVARVPVDHISGADEACMKWLRTLQDQDCLLMLNCPSVESEYQSFIWLIVFTNPVIKRVILKDSSLAEHLL
ncbi:hypothetical protein VOLCADRAFT_93106 [Volvox carteri f. nagariensis]|uniref:Uncharacterized protein n=1 Tax=Volvox carteri f. nagariensis TaxID=3068 RepID=D8U1D0_VOLCA|nr:uncharacterized protein VOLCADRAFT_93106 [Volvox carteri f. nagariensis]EFJ46614.1 hypothetical protein VOLCADRAFT_93106 [Volvox carteri f. nagariensis]|eukprot:XP_002952471.1 hypothetical protein VOLCADRAFT_93106 [Volvox carteri f. nagariensis]